MNFIKVYFSEEEREKLLQIAKAENIPLSQLIKSQCKVLLDLPVESGIGNIEKLEERSLRSNSFEMRLTDEEMQQLKNEAEKRGWSMSRYVREKLYERDTPITIEYQTNDIHELTVMINDTYRHLIGTADGLKYRSVITENDQQRIKDLAYELKDALERCATQAYRNRNAIRKNALRHLDKEIKKAVEQKLKKGGN